MERIGFIGLGIMGNPMAKHLLKAGYQLTVFDLNHDAVDNLVQVGATAATHCREVAEKSDVVITMVPDSPDVEQAVLGRNGVSGGLRSGMLFIDMSTIAPMVSRKIYETLIVSGVESLDAPVSGGQVGAEAGTLSIMVGGSEKAFQRALPVLQAMGKQIVRIGEAGAGQMAKVCNQMIVAVAIQAVAEALTLAKKAGIDIQKVREALLGGFAQSRILDLHGQRIIERNFKPGFKVKLHRKDLNIALQTGRELHVPLLGTTVVAEQLDALLAQGRGELDHSALALQVEDLAAMNP